MNELILLEGPTVVYAYNALDRRDRKVFRAVGNQSIRELRPKTSQPLVILWNGNYVLPEDEDYIPRNGDHLVYMHLPLGGGNVSQEILGVILIVVGIVIDVYTGGTGGNYFIAAGLGLLVSGLVPVPKSPNNQLQNSQSASPTYNVSIAGNQARIGQSIPVVYGRHILLPDFAAQPYVEYDSNGDQYYFAIMCLGQMRPSTFTIESIQIADTDLSHFVDVQYKVGNQFIPPDFPLAGPFAAPYGLANPAVVSNTAVANNTMVYGTLIGPFSVCGPGLQAQYIGVDIACPKGLYHANDSGGLDPVTVHWIVEYRLIDDNNLPVGIWGLLDSQSLTAANATPIRRSFKYLVTPGRYEVRVSRLEAENTDSRYGMQLSWIGLRAYLTIAAPMELTAQYLHLKIKADSQLSGLSQRQVSVIIQRWLPTWNPSTGWSAPVYTRSPIWAAVDVMRNSDYGGTVSDDRIDLPTFYQLSQIAAARQDYCDVVFDTRTVLWSALQIVLATCRAHPLMRGSVFTAVRDGLQNLPVALFNMRNIKAGSFKISFNMVNEDTTDGIETAFFNSQTWSTAYIRKPLPGYTESVNPTSVTLVGISNEVQAERETLYMIADASYRRTSITFETELEGYLPAFGDLISVAHDVPSWGQSGEFERWDGVIAQTTEDLQFGAGSNYVTFIDQYGDPQGPYQVTPGPTERTMRFIDYVAIDKIYIGTDRERTRYAFGAGSTYSTVCKITGIVPSDANVVSIKATLEDNRVHSADNALLPGTSSGGTGGTGGGTIPGAGRVAIYTVDGLPNYDAASDAQHAVNGFYANDSGTVGTSSDPGYVYDY